jgi:hypothetical protein
MRDYKEGKGRDWYKPSNKEFFDRYGGAKKLL